MIRFFNIKISVLALRMAATSHCFARLKDERYSSDAIFQKLFYK
ncbi:hypothetical protein HMPREF9373_1375 [Psychrobacter sp. 1501(2011)]|nr:hypothetical protein HMPREF9373_1375 [Psychrobacter sp. 1501(2011)]